MQKREGIALVPGRFDPITLGHLDIIRRASEIYEHVIVAVMINPEKRYRFTIEERKEIAVSAVEDLPNVKVISSEGMLWRLAEDLGATAIVKGVRNEIDRAYELAMAEYNNARCEAVTVLWESSPELEEISSTRVRECLERGESFCGYLPTGAIQVIEKIINKEK